MTDNPFRKLNDDLKRQQREYRLQVCVVEQIPGWFPGLRFFHVPNRPGSAADGFHKKRMGAKSGVSDSLFTWQGARLCEFMHSIKTLECGIIELKADANEKPSPDQNKFMSSYASIGWHTGICYTAQGVFNTICSWGLRPAHKGVIEPDYRTENQKKADSFDFFMPQKDAPVDTDAVLRMKTPEY